MATLVYRFDKVEAFPRLESESTVGGRVDRRVEEDAGGTYLHITVGRGISAAADMRDEGRRRAMGEAAEEAAAETAVVFGLPLIAIAGAPEAFELDVRGDGGGCHLTTEAGDAWGWGFAYSFGQIDFSGWRTCKVDVQRPSEFWGDRKERDTSRIVPPVQLFRLRLVLPERCPSLSVGLRALRVTGRARLASPGLASDARG